MKSQSGTLCFWAYYLPAPLLLQLGTVNRGMERRSQRIRFDRKGIELRSKDAEILRVRIVVLTRGMSTIKQEFTSSQIHRNRKQGDTGEPGCYDRTKLSSQRFELSVDQSESKTNIKILIIGHNT